MIQYILTTPGATPTYEDSFVFDVYDSQPNRIPDNVFHITWSTVEFKHSLMNVTERAGSIEVPIVRKGNLKQVSWANFYFNICTEFYVGTVNVFTEIISVCLIILQVLNRIFFFQVLYDQTELVENV